MTKVAERCDDQVVLNLWHPVSATAEMDLDVVYETMLLGECIEYTVSGSGAQAVQAVGEPRRDLPVREHYGYLWTSLGSPPNRLFDIPEFDEPDRRSLNAGSFMVATSAPRAIENFLDMGHFPYVHTDLLGVEPHTEVTPYRVGINEAELWATECEFFQPVAAASATGGQMSEYTYRVPHPYCVMLYKSVPADPTRRDVIGLFVQAMTQETVRAHNFLCAVDNTSSDTVLRRFQQIIFSQDKPILENQRPKRLPLDPRAEVPIRADQSSIVYRRWLTELDVRYATIPA